MYLTRTPLRVSFFGGGSDYPVWYREEGGAVLSTAIDKYIYVSCRYLPPFFSVRHRIVWRHVELVDSIAEILHPAVRQGLQDLGFDDDRGIELHYQGDLPARSGMGSSSSFVVGLIQALMCLRGEVVTKERLADMAIHLERDVMNETVGSQDQVAAAFGGLNVIRFRPDDSYEVEPLALPAEREDELMAHLMLVFPGQNRIASSVARDVACNLHKQADNVRRMMALVDEGAEILRNGDVADFGALLHEAWERKRQISHRVSTPRIDELYAAARASGADGGKLLGAGGAGFMLFFAKPERQEAVRTALSHCLHVPLGIDHGGARRIYASEEPGLSGSTGRVVAHRQRWCMLGGRRAAETAGPERLPCPDRRPVALGPLFGYANYRIGGAMGRMAPVGECMGVVLWTDLAMQDPRGH